MARHRDALPRLNIPASLNMQQPMQTMYSPALPTSIQQSFHPPLPMQTPMQNFFPQVPSAPGRPAHHAGQASVAQLAAAGIHPPSGYPMTPMGGHFSRPSMMMNGPPGGHPFPGRNRRQLSIGGPPKAVLGGPNRKLSPIPPAAVTATGSSTSPAPQVKPKKIVVNLPKEDITGDNGQTVCRASWARNPLDDPVILPLPDVAPVETYSIKIYPSDDWRFDIPPTIDVFLPGKMAIEEKLEKLGVERGSGSNAPHIYAPHARAASISSPADPALLLFKLNKLQQSQNASSNNSMAPSPQPSFGMSPSPHQQGPRFMMNRHGHSMSLAQPPTQSLYPYNNGPLAALNPFGHDAVLGSDQIPSRSPRVSPGPPGIGEIHAPQGRVPVALPSLAPPALSTSRPDSRPDFNRGFGLDIPEEEEEEEEEAVEGENMTQTDSDEEAFDEEVDDDGDRGTEDAGLTTASQGQYHSRHTSKLSAALSLRSFGVFNVDGTNERTDLEPVADGNISVEEKHDLDGVEEWTGSEDVFMGHESSEDESIGEWSNPSDEERARQQHLERRTRRRALQQDAEQPRRIPNFPRPPENTMVMSVPGEADIISNPSEEEQLQDHEGYLSVHNYYERPPSNMSGRSSRPLPPLPHSRLPSGQHSIHDPAQAHSRHSSDVNFGFPEPKPAVPRLNPNAKPFVFGAPLENSWKPDSFTGSGDHTHSRFPSFGKPLNASAQEFKPSAFTFKAVGPAFPLAEPFRPLPVPPVSESSPFRVQGREKRRRHGSNESVEEGDSMASFKFPPPADSPVDLRQMPLPRPDRSGHSSLNPSVEPFTFAGFSAAATLPPIPPADPAEETFEDESTARAEYGDSQMDASVLPSSSKAKRAPIPLDFMHTVSNNTVPAGLFKALVNNGGDERTRRTVRSRLSSREIFDHVSHPSLDDLSVPAISHKVSRSRLVTDPGQRQVSPTEDVFGSTRHSRRRSSLPDALHPFPSGSSISETSVIHKDLTSRFELHRIEDLLDEKIAVLRHDIRGGSTLNPNTEAMINEVLSLFRTQLRDSATRSLEDTQLDARGELDFQLIKDVIEQAHAETLAHLKQELSSISQTFDKGRPILNPGVPDVTLEQYSTRTIQAINEAISEMSVRLESIGRAAPARERDAIVDAVVSALSPVLSSIRSDSVDYDYLSEKLSHAVKPNISQLIDLASDKRETAGLIVKQLIPLLPNLQEPSPAVDTDAISLQLTSAVTRAIAPIDAFEIKEQVADLVVERLDARLANRDKTLTLDGIASRVTDSISGLLEPLQSINNTLSTLVEGQRSLASQQSDLSSAQGDVVANMTDLPSKILSAVQDIGTQIELLSKGQVNEDKVTAPDENIVHIKSVMDGLTDKQRTLAEQSGEILGLHKDVIQKINALPESFSVATSVLQQAHAEFTLSRDAVKHELEDLRKTNTDLQVQVAKARGAHGQVRVEKEVLSEKLGIVEADRDLLRTQLKDLQDSVAAKAEESAVVDIRNTELQDALAKALSRLQSSDVATQSNQERIAELEKANQELLFDKRTLKTKIDALEMKVAFASRDKDLAEETIAALRKQNEDLTTNSSQWDSLRQASEQIQVIANLMHQSDDEELQELKCIRDRSKLLEGEHSMLQKRFKDQEGRLSNVERAAFTARQSLSQAQQRASEWENRAKEYEGKLEHTQTMLDQAEQTQAQLDADYSLVKMQVEEREADERLAKDREARLRDQISALEAKIRVMQTEFERSRNANSKTPTITIPRNGMPRPDSRTSTEYSRSRSVTPNGHTPPQSSVWDSMHAPKSNGVHPSPYTPTPSRYPTALIRGTPRRRSQLPLAPPSPTPSTISLTPTVDEDGWWR
ncbi:uncharacterized protein BT62DRAFT_1045593 [Guyanagaster necrorhizus]|uniref:Uncharacterized protein n=1 Tax=Guyanagaster necrorhizus TaxID=856835 RepID=A0A9P7W2F5_9AGAR|nr:uncharacterized protein BT62DRAFT_1045593 [Guyanagaster necrorhizus MCA 3950]KAG7450750.1 hypothetical protein BT62DRAFT_1045593 [Guyanagaster necrorhizus MCA 3950]